MIATNYANHTGVKGETEGMMVVGVRESLVSCEGNQGNGGGLGERGVSGFLPLILWLGSLYTFLPTCTIQSSHTWNIQE